jgi:hypothetical protein
MGHLQANNCKRHQIVCAYQVMADNQAHEIPMAGQDVLLEPRSLFHGECGGGMQLAHR